MCGRNQKTDLGELLSERRMKPQIRGNDPDSWGAYQGMPLRREKLNPKKERR
jgi:hypothetical protein